MLALGMVAEYFDEPEWIEAYDTFLKYYTPWFRKRAERKVPTGRWPHDTYRATRTASIWCSSARGR